MSAGPMEADKSVRINRGVFERDDAAAGLEPSSRYPYDKEMISIRHSILRKYGVKGKAVLDLGCGTGNYLSPILDDVGFAVGLDFSRKMLDALAKKAGASRRNSSVQADVRKLPFANSSFDLVYSFCAIYYVPNVALAISEVGRLLKPGGYAVLEFGNKLSLNRLVSMRFHLENGWARPECVRVKEFIRPMQAAGFQIVEHRCFQLVPLYGAPQSLRYLWPILHPRWKHIAGLKIGGRMLDEWISSLWPLQEVAFRHLVVAKMGR